MRIRVLIVAGAGLLFCSGIVPAQQAAAPTAQGDRTVLDGVYTKAQAERGHTAYEQSCATRCHGSDLNGGNPPPLHASEFLDNWREDYLASLYDLMSTRMPKGDNNKPGALPEQDYLDILAYILAFNDFPAGARELTRADVNTTRLVGPGGAAPLPANALVRVVGCFGGGSRKWTLSQATSPSRVRVADETDARELGKSAATPSGTLDFQLNNLDTERSDADLSARLQHRMQVKGVMNGSGDSARIYVLSFEQVRDSCG